jgi:hypothetical protein
VMRSEIKKKIMMEFFIPSTAKQQDCSTREHAFITSAGSQLNWFCTGFHRTGRVHVMQDVCLCTITPVGRQALRNLDWVYSGCDDFSSQMLTHHETNYPRFEISPKNYMDATICKRVSIYRLHIEPHFRRFLDLAIWRFFS